MDCWETFPQYDAFELDDYYGYDNLLDHFVWQTPILCTSTVFPTAEGFDDHRRPSLLSLPMEIRRLIYEYLIQSDRAERWVDILDIPPPQPPRSITAYFPAEALVPAPSIHCRKPPQTSLIRTKNNLFGVNKQIRYEYADTMLKHSVLIIDTWTCDSLQTQGASIMNNLRKLKFKPESLNDYFMSLPTLRKCVGLYHLEIELDARGFDQARMFLAGALKTLQSARTRACSPNGSTIDDILRQVVVIINIVNENAPTWFINRPAGTSRNIPSAGQELSRYRDHLLRKTVETTDDNNLLYYAAPLVLPLGVQKFVLHMAMSTSQYTYLRDEVDVPGCERFCFRGGCTELYSCHPEGRERKHCVQWLRSE